MRFVLLLFLASLSVSSAYAAVWGDDPSEASPEYKASMAICQKSKSLSLSKPDPAMKVGADCDASALYYGIGVPANPVAARACALRVGTANKDGSDDPMQGPAILATIYANGTGAPRNLDLAIAYACRMDGAPAEMDGRIAHLTKLKKDGPGKTPFDVCDDITSGLMMGFCAQRDADMANAKSKVVFADIEKGLDAQQKAAFGKLLKVEEAYVTAVGEHETDSGGTIGASNIIGAKQAQREAFVATLRSVFGGKTVADAASFADSDRLLNATYGKVMGLKDTSGFGTVEKADIKTTQRTWLIYRDAFVAFAKLAAPNVPPEAIKTELTIQRTKLLSAFLS